MKQKGISRIVLSLGILLFLGSWGPDASWKENKSFDECTLDIFAHNNTSVAIEYVKFQSSIETEMMANISGSGGTASGVFTWDKAQGCAKLVKLGSSPGSGRIRIFKSNMHTLIYCANFNNNLTIPLAFDIGADVTCPEGFFVIVDTSSCS